jgi:heptosyltransferase III
MLSKARNAALPLVARGLLRPPLNASGTILLLQPDHLGDIVLSQPAVRTIRETYPNKHLVAVVGPWSEEIARIAWPVDDVVVIEYPGFERAPKRSPLDPYRQLRSAATALKVLEPEAAVVLRPDAWWVAWLAALVAPQVAASSDPRVAPFATTTAEIPPGLHAVERARRIAEVFAETRPIPSDTRGGERSPLSIARNDAAHLEAQGLLKKRGIDGPYTVIHPTSGAPAKDWPLHRWRAVAADLVKRGYQVAVTGTHADALAVNALVDDINGCVSLAGATPLPVLVEVLRQASMVLGSDSGPLHLAVAVKTPSVTLFGPSDVHRYGPWGDQSRHCVIHSGMSCRRCGDLSLDRTDGCGCMLSISVDDVQVAYRGMLGAP